jgi:hypothetical protein
MGERTAQIAVLATFAVVLGSTLPAAASSQHRPRAGKFAGQERYDSDSLPVTFTVSRDRARVLRFVGQAAVKDGCTNHITGFQATSKNYPQPGVRVRVTGRFVSRSKARGHVSVRIANSTGCNVSRPFSARRALQQDRP